MKDEKQLRKCRILKQQLRKYCLAGLTAFMLFLLIYYWSHIAGLIGLLASSLVPLLIGTVVAYLVNILVQLIETHLPEKKPFHKPKVRRAIALTGALITIVGGIVLIGMLVIPQFTACIKTLVQKAPAAMNILLSYPAIAQIIPDDWGKMISSIDWSSVVSTVQSMLQNGLTSKLSSGLSSGISQGADAISSGLSGLLDIVLGIVFAFYILLEKDHLRQQFGNMTDAYLNPQNAARLKHIVGLFNRCFHSYVVGQCLEALILGGLCTLGMLLLKIPYAAMIGVLVGVTALIPVAGCYIGAAVGALMILSVDSPKAVLFLIFLMILQQVEGNLIYPKVVGSSVGLSGLWVLAAITVGGAVMGIPGMMVAVPIAATMYQLLRDDVRKRNSEKQTQ